MTSVAVFVDAGYLFAQGATALSGTNVARSQLKLDSNAAVAALTTVALAKSQGCRLLRIYWYDGTYSGRLSLDQAALATTDNIKLRLGQINSAGQQKGVDSLIVTDLIELARNQAVSDALLVGGDEDVRIGVQIAQSFGVRVHLLGIKANKSSQSPLLMQEADTTSLFDKSDIEKFLTIKAGAVTPVVMLPRTNTAATLDHLAVELAANLDDDQIQAFSDFRKQNKGIPSEFDGKLLATARDQFGRDLDHRERRIIRTRFFETVKLRKPDLF